jgi:hypothetical protein
MGIGNVGRAFLLGTSALVMTSAAASAGPFDITADTVANQTLDAGETGTVQAGFTLSQSDTALPTVDIIGSGATLTNLGAIAGTGPAVIGVRATGLIVGVSVTNSGRISGFRAAFGATAEADITGGVTNELGGVFSGGIAGIGVFTDADISGGVDNSGSILGGVTGINVFKTADISGGVDNSGTVFGGTIGINVNAPGVTSNPSDISGGVLNQAGGVISGGVTGVHVDIISSISGGIDNSGVITGIRNQGTIGSLTQDRGIAMTGAGADITGQGVVNETVATLSGTVAGLSAAGGANISGGVDNSGLVKGGLFGVFLNSSNISGGVLNQVGGKISGGTTGFRLSNASDVSGGHTIATLPSRAWCRYLL